VSEKYKIVTTKLFYEITVFWDVMSYRLVFATWKYK